MPDTPPAIAGRAVFVSYAREDSASAQRIAEALRTGGVEVWLDQEGGLVGGDAWDRKIREQINGCALFVPLISANTQARHEGYFRLEWKLAEDRSHLIAKGKPFIVPVSVDATAERGALVPDAFTAVQWTRLPGGEAPVAFVARVRKLLGAAPPEPTVAVRGAPGPPAEPTQSSELTAKNLELSTAVRLPLDGAFETFVPQRSLWRRALPVVSAVIVTALVVGLAVAWRLWPAPAPMTRFTYRLPDGQTFRNPRLHVIAVSPDGRKFVFNTTGGLYLRSLDELEAHVIRGTEETLGGPFFSPDGQSVGYYKGRQLKRVAVSGGTPVDICAAANNPSGPSWAPDGTILFGQPEGILRVPATGGTPVVVITAQNGMRLGSPQLLPDGDTVLLTERSLDDTSNEVFRIVAQKISTGARKVLVEGGADARYLATGHLVYTVRNVLMGVAFDARRLTIMGGAVPVVQGVMRAIGNASRAGNYGVGADGTLVWAYGENYTEDKKRQLGLSDRAGKLTALPLPPGFYDQPRVSPDGTRLAVGVADDKGDYIAVYDLDGKTALRRLTFGGNNSAPVWSRDGQRVTFQSDRDGAPAIFWQRADGASPAERLTRPAADTSHLPRSWSPNDETLLFSAAAGTGPNALWMHARATGEDTPFAGVQSTVVIGAVFSPDGRWVAYASGESQYSATIYVQPFPATGATYQWPAISGSGNPHQPLWSPDGKSLYCNVGVASYAIVSVTTQPAFAFGSPTVVPKNLVMGPPLQPRQVDFAPDGKLVGLIQPGQAADATGNAQPEIRIVLNWFDELKRLVPVK